MIQLSIDNEISDFKTLLYISAVLKSFHQSEIE